MTKGVITRKIKVNNYSYDLEIYPNLDGHKEIAWEIFPHDYQSSLYAFSNKDSLNKFIETNYVFEK